MQTIKKNDEVQFVTCSIVFPFVATERFYEVGLQLGYTSLKSLLSGKPLYVLLQCHFNLIEPYIECEIAKPYRLIDWWCFLL